MAKVEYYEPLKTVAEWIEILKELPQDSVIIMSKDGEGNEFSPLSNYGTGIYVADTTYSGEIYNEDEYDEEEDDNRAGVKAVVLWPTN